MNEATVIAYPVDSPNNRSHSNNSHLSHNSLMEENIYASSLGDSKFADDTIEMSGNFFSQLDSMIAAVKVQSSALDSMKEKLREVENLRNQISMFTKRLLDADQANLNLKSNLVKVQEMYAEAKKAKAEVESSIVPIRAELNRTKDQCNKERMGRLGAQQQLAGLKDQVAMLEQANENLDREVKTIPALAESNEILKNDLTQLRRRYKEEKAQMTKHIKHLEAQARDVDAVKGVVRDLSMKLLDIANSGSTNSISNTSNSNSPMPNLGVNMGVNMGNMGGGAGNAAYLAQQQQQQQLRYQQAQQQARYGGMPQQQQQQPMQGQMQGQNPQQQQQGNVYYQYGFNHSSGAPLTNGSHPTHSTHSNTNTHTSTNEVEDDDASYEDADDESDYNDETEANITNEYEQDSFVEVNSSIESVGSLALANGASGGAGKASVTAGKGSGGKKKKSVRRAGANGAVGAQVNRTQALQHAPQGQVQGVPRQAGQGQPRLMQQLEPSGGGSGGGMYQQQQQYRNTVNGGSGNVNSQQGMVQSFSLPRI